MVEGVAAPLCFAIIVDTALMVDVFVGRLVPASASFCIIIADL
jgi:hypothetical protein